MILSIYHMLKRHDLCQIYPAETMLFFGIFSCDCSILVIACRQITAKRKGWYSLSLSHSKSSKLHETRLRDQYLFFSINTNDENKSYSILQKKPTRDQVHSCELHASLFLTHTRNLVQKSPTLQPVLPYTVYYRSKARRRYAPFPKCKILISS